MAVAPAGVLYAKAERTRIIPEVRRVPDRATDGPATRSLVTLKCARRARRAGPVLLGREHREEQLLVYLQPAGIKRLKMIGVQEDRAVFHLVAEAVNEWFQRRGLPPVA